jgi:hypothetical protein
VSVPSAVGDAGDAAPDRTRALRANTLTWLALCGLTLTSFLVSDSLARAALVPILVVAGAKCSLIGFQFMGLRAAHPLLRACFLVLFAAVVFALWIANRPG